MEFGRYDVVEVLGEGATGIVYRAEAGGEDVAVKALAETDPIVRRRFEREARIAAQARSRHVVPILEVGDGYIVMPYYERGTLGDAIRRDGGLPIATVTRIAAELADGLDALHAVGIVHRDVKPSNVLLGEEGALLSDFGLARGADSTQLTRDGQLVGSAHYLAPELIEGHPAGPASDIYAFGCLLHECVTGAPPFTGRADSELGYAHLVESPPDVRVLRPDAGEELAAAILYALDKEPSARPTTATALARMLHLADRSAPA